MLSLDPTDRRGEISCDGIVSPLSLKAHIITNILLIADLLILGVLVELTLVLAGGRLVEGMTIESWDTMELKLEIASAVD